jgi:hypothetical protein
MIATDAERDADRPSLRAKTSALLPKIIEIKGAGL